MAFQDRADAGRQLAARLTTYADRRDVIVLALARGGVPVGCEVAAALRAPLDVLVVQRLVAPWNHQDVTIGALTGGGFRVVDEELCRALNLSAETVQKTAEQDQGEVDRRQCLYRDCCKSMGVRDRTVILVDDGMVTGASMGAAVLAVQARKPAATVIAVPVASYATCAELAGRVEAIVHCFIRAPVYAVNLWYDAYPPVSDEEACRLLRQRAPASAALGGSANHFRELGADATVSREESFEERGFPSRGSDVEKDEERGPEPKHATDETRHGPTEH